MTGTSNFHDRPPLVQVVSIFKDISWSKKKKEGERVSPWKNSNTVGYKLKKVLLILLGSGLSFKTSCFFNKMFIPYSLKQSCMSSFMAWHLFKEGSSLWVVLSFSSISRCLLSSNRGMTCLFYGTNLDPHNEVAIWAVRGRKQTLVRCSKEVLTTQ